MYCSRCGAQVAEGAGFCSACGQRVFSAAADPAANSVSAAPSPWGQTAGSGVHAEPRLYAGFWLRLVAAIIDWLILGFAIGIPFAFVIVAKGLSNAAMEIHPGEPLSGIFALFGAGLIAAFFITSVIAGWLYFALMESSPLQGTLGKKALGLYVTDRQGNRASFGRTSGRYFGGRFLWHVPAFGLLYGFIDGILAGLSTEKQAVHDMIADCLVLRKV